MNASDPLASALGAVREGAQAIENLRHLLGSRRVGPKAIGRAIVDVRDGCVTFGTSLGILKQELVDLLRADDEASALASTLLDRAKNPVSRLLEVLQSLQKVEVDARARLVLEADIQAVSDELAALLSSVELLASAAMQRVTELDVRDVLRGFVDANRVPSMFDVESGRATFIGDARVVIGLLSFACSIVAQAAGLPASATPNVILLENIVTRIEIRISATQQTEDALSPRLFGAPSKGVTEQAEMRGTVRERVRLVQSADALAVAQAVARLSGVEISIEPSQRVIALVLGAKAKGVEPALGVVERGV